ncbi:MAG: hypothetical protein AAB565_00590 [Patescibacteria group bacterium]
MTFKLSKIIIFLIIIILGALIYFLSMKKAEAPIVPKEREEKMGEAEAEKLPSFKQADFSKFNSSFKFMGKIPAGFEIEYIPQLKALSIYDPNFSGENVREKSQIYITYFEANGFLTLSTVDILKREETLTRGYDAVFYEIAKKSVVPDFSQQPSWRNQKHTALDIRFTRNSPSLFYSFARNPDLSEGVFNDFINFLEFHN